MIQFGNDKIKEIYVGSDKIKEVYHGSDLVWTGKKPSYAILTDGTRVDFEFENTPMSNFEGSTDSTILNGISYQKTNIKEITFGSSYGQVTSIGDNFFYYYTSLISADLSGFVNVTIIGVYFLRACNSLISVDLSGFVNVTRIRNFFMYGCDSLPSIDLGKSTKIEVIDSNFATYCRVLNTFYIGTVVPPTLASSSFNNSPIQIIKVPAQSVNAYKTATNWNSYASKISAI